MFETHTTQDGDKMLVAQMVDRHLIATIKLHCRKLREYAQLIERSPQQGDLLLGAMRDDFSLEKAQKAAQANFRTRHERLKPYVLEAALRGLEIAPFLQEAYMRSQLSSRATILPLFLLAISWLSLLKKTD